MSDACPVSCDCGEGECQLGVVFALGVQFGLTLAGASDPHRADNGD